jgi:hypothetical protein
MKNFLNLISVAFVAIIAILAAPTTQDPATAAPSAEQLYYQRTNA